MSKAIFLDRDGTIIVDHPYLGDPKKIEFLPGAIEALREFIKKGYQLFLVSNQSGIGRGLITHEQVQSIHRELQSQLEVLAPPGFTEMVYCPHHPDDNCTCRKPKGLMIEQLLERHKLNASACFMIGDKESDVEAGNNAGVKGLKTSGRLLELFELNT